MAKRTWFSAAAGTAGSADIAIYDEIGAWGMTAADFRNALAGLGDVRHIDLRLNSPGGDVFDGLAIYNMLARHPAKIAVTVDGLAGSIASIIMMAGDTIAMAENSFVAIHNPSGLAMGEASDMDEVSGALRKIGDAMAATYARRTGQTPEKIAELMDARVWMTAHEAKALGFVDIVGPSVKMAARLDLDKLGVPAALAAKITAAYDPDNDGDDDVLEALGFIGQAVDSLADAVGALTGTGDSDDQPNNAAQTALATPIKGKISLLQRIIAALPRRASTSAEAQLRPAPKPDPSAANAMDPARLDEVIQISAACQLAGFADRTTAFLQSGKTFAEVQSELQALKIDRGRGPGPEISGRNNPVPDYEVQAASWAKTIEKLNAARGARD